MQTQRDADKLNLSELIDEVKGLVVGSWRFRWLALGLAWIVCLASWFYIPTMPDIYKASTRLYIDTEDSLKPLLEGLAINPDVLDEVRVMVKSITSRPNLERIATESGLDMQVQESAKKDELLKRLKKDITIKLYPDQILEISFEEANPRIAKSVVANLFALFVGGLQGTSRGDSQSAQLFIESKVKEYEQLLTEAEMRLANFKKRNVGQMPGEQGDYYQRLESESAKLAELESDLKLATQKRDILTTQIAGETMNSQQIIQLEAELIEQRLRYTDSHPDIVRIKALLESLRAGLAKQQPNTISPDFSQLETSPVYQELKHRLGLAELEIARLGSKGEGQKQLVDDLRQKIDILPEIEAELTRLNRNYDTNKAQYDALLGRLERARLSEAAEESTTSIRFRIIEPPTVTSAPVRPNRLLLVTLALFLGITGGAAIAVFFSFTRPVFYSSKKLEQQFGIPVIGSIKWRRSPAQIVQAWKRAGVFSICVLGLIACYLAVVLGQQAGVFLWGPAKSPMIG